jgi:hypothetical protein
MPRSAEEKARIEALRVELTTLTARFCEAHLDAEHAALAAALIAKMARKREVPFLHGSAKLWAAGAVYALAQLNFLFDRDAPVRTSPDEITGFFGVSKTSVGTKAKAIRNLFKMRYFDPEFSNQRIRASHPLRNWVITLADLDEM